MIKCCIQRKDNLNMDALHIMASRFMKQLKEDVVILGNFKTQPTLRDNDGGQYITDVRTT